MLVCTVTLAADQRGFKLAGFIAPAPANRHQMVATGWTVAEGALAAIQQARIPQTPTFGRILFTDITMFDGHVLLGEHHGYTRPGVITGRMI